MPYGDSLYNLDYDVAACLEYNTVDGMTGADVAAILAVIEGENDGAAWHWILLLNDQRLAYLTGGCDYTGWDCQSNAEAYVASTTKEALDLGAAAGEIGKYEREELERQLLDGKNITWREKMRRELPNSF